MSYVEQALISPPVEIERFMDYVRQLDISPGPGGSRMSDFQQTQALFVSDLAQYFGSARIKQVTVSTLYPSSQIVAHQDHPNTVYGLRFHCPLRMNQNCFVFHDDRWQRLTVGQWYEMNPTKEHGAVNWGATIRLHLVVDVA